MLKAGFIRKGGRLRRQGGAAFSLPTHAARLMSAGEGSNPAADKTVAAAATPTGWGLDVPSYGAIKIGMGLCAAVAYFHKELAGVREQAAAFHGATGARLDVEKGLEKINSRLVSMEGTMKKPVGQPGSQ